VPEGDTVHLSASRLDAALAGRSLTATDFRVPAFATADLTGQRVLEVAARGKHLLFRTDGAVTLHTHFDMEGTWHLYKPGARWRGAWHEIRAILTTDEWIAVGFRLAIVELRPTAREDEVLGHLGPDVLGADWDADEALRRLLEDPGRSIGDALLDQRVMAGPGNIYRNEVCFLLRVHPDTLVRDLPEPGRAVELTKRLMEANRSTGRQVTTGNPNPGFERYVYGRGRKPCRRCGSAVLRDARTDERVAYWCPRCQA
jgi:endonuclease-8